MLKALLDVLKTVVVGEYFQALDYAALSTSLTCLDSEISLQVERAYIIITKIPGNTTEIVYPEFAPEINDQLSQIHKRLNLGRFDR